MFTFAREQGIFSVMGHCCHTTLKSLGMTNQNVLCRCSGAALNWQGELYKADENGWSGIQDTQYSDVNNGRRRPKGQIGGNY